MSEKELPRKSPMGAQLGIGVRSSALYNSSDRRNKTSQHRWENAYDDQLSGYLSQLRISSSRRMVDELTQNAKKQSQDAINDDYFVSDEADETDENDMDEEVTEHWREVLLSRLSWDSLSPVIPPNFQYLKDVEVRREHMYDIKSKLNSAHEFVPGSLITDLARSDLVSTGQAGNQSKTRSASSFDPTIGNLFITGEVQTIPDLRNNIQPRRIMVYSSGRANSILNIAVIDERKEIDSVSPDFDQIRTSTSVEMMSRIKSIKLSNLSAMLGRKSDLIGVMTESALHMIKLENISSHHEIKMSLCEPIPFKEFGDFPFADFALNPWDLRQFAVVDVKGNFGLGQMPKALKTGSKCRMSHDNSGTIFDPEELSNWKRIEWSSSFTRLIVMDRSKLIELDFDKDWQLEVIQAKTWSRLLDYHRLDDDYGILLTSREIIVISTKQSRDQLTREVSWKHDLNPEDTTLKLCVQEVGFNEKKLLLVCITSRNYSQLYVHCFSLNKNDSIIQSAGNPVLLQVPHVKEGLKGICLYDRVGDDETEDWTANHPPAIQLSMFLNENGSKKFWHYVVSNDRVLMNQGESERSSNMGEGGSSKQSDHLYSQADVPSVVPQICQSVLAAAISKAIPQSESELFQAYGYQMSEAINELLLTWVGPTDSLSHLHVPLQSLAAAPSDIRNLSEFTSLMQQLSDHYLDQGLKFTEFRTISSILLQEEDSGDLDILYSKLLQCWDLVTSNSERLTRGVIRDAVVSALYFCKPSLYQEAEVKLKECLSDSYRDIVDSWTEDDISTDMTQSDLTAFSQSQLLQGSQSQIPTIKASQTRSSRKFKRRAIGLSSGKISKLSDSQPSFNRDNMAAPPLLSSSQLSSTLPETMTPAFSLMQSASGFSQSQSSQRSKRKKKRVGGFG